MNNARLFPAIGHSARGGFMLVEAMVAMVLLGFISLIAVGALFFAQSSSLSGRFQVRCNSDARISSQKIFDIVYQTNRLSPPLVLNGNRVRLFFRHDSDTREEEGCLEFMDLDGNPSTWGDNFIRFDPDIANRVIVGQEQVLAKNVSPVPGQDIFSVAKYANGLTSLKVAYLVGDNKASDSGRFSASGTGYQGVKVGFTVAPRNVDESFNWAQALGRQAGR